MPTTATPAASGTTPGATTDASLSGFVAIQIGSQTFTLSGTIAKAPPGGTTPGGAKHLPAINVSYQQDFASAVDLGELDTVLSELATKLGLDQQGGDLAAEITNALKALPIQLPQSLSDITKAHIRITALTIDSATKPGTIHFTFGGGLDFSANPPTLGPVSLQAIGATIDIVRTNPA